MMLEERDYYEDFIMESKKEIKQLHAQLASQELSNIERGTSVEDDHIPEAKKTLTLGSTVGTPGFFTTK